MWLSEKMSEKEPAAQSAAVGTVSLEEEAPAAVTDTEIRALRVLSPGGYRWQPALGQEVLVLKGPAPALLGVQEPGETLESGEVLLFSRGASVKLCNDGSIRITGDVHVNGKIYSSEEQTP